MAAVKKLMVIGKVVRKLAPKISLVEVQTNRLDSYLNMYFGHYDQYRADDGPHLTKVDDYVLIRSKAKPERVDLIYEVTEVVIRDGVLRDPLTGKRVVGDKNRIDFLEDMQGINRLLPDQGKCQESLKYSENDVPDGLPQAVRDKS
ncbi:hypothetical protein BV898_04206 [Hypsibius exemplaris]|uniref:28S ribosomal protein S17, mitochondrial n=1 Tax=Hypsibius exemplaris TaxID=2072580 RepID=A0A1W0X3C8_HYPEX|nr:hypothetical protein BV898_04206 [Hypsibius exemplaris]